ncbi:hypothetical protein ZIOFF_048472 [Zingiber officinale]|uniref:Uncharacterized protein n=1 Tax=Zingiber officinale TaxID=94328 RepID=A0A8J5FV57_ZINOF|nr:hypothetical protein ZIOFF_048472 [Zingiber officinale]
MTCVVQLVRLRLSVSIEIVDVERFRFHSSFITPLLCSLDASSYASNLTFLLAFPISILDISDCPSVVDLVSMGRGRGKGKKLTVSTSQEDPGGYDGEEVLTAFRRGKPLKPLKEDIDEDDAEKIGGEDDMKLSAPKEEVEGPTVVVKKRRKRDSKSEENSVKTENGAGSKSMEQSSSSNSFRRSGSRRKGKPCRAAGVGVVCNSLLAISLVILHDQRRARS